MNRCHKRVRVRELTPKSTEFLLMKKKWGRNVKNQDDGPGNDLDLGIVDTFHCLHHVKIRHQSYLHVK